MAKTRKDYEGVRAPEKSGFKQRPRHHEHHKLQGFYGKYNDLARSASEFSLLYITSR